MNKQEAIEKIEKLKGLNIKEKNLILDIEMIPKGEVLEIVDQLDELEKPVVPQFVADFYESIKDNFETKLYNYFVEFYNGWEDSNSDFDHWFNSSAEPIQTLVKMKLFGYVVKEEKLYTVEIPNPNRADVSLVLGLYNDGKVAIFAAFTDSWKYEKQYKLTEAEIKQDFEWAWQFAKEVEE